MLVTVRDFETCALIDDSLAEIDVNIFRETLAGLSFVNPEYLNQLDSFFIGRWIVPSYFCEVQDLEEIAACEEVEPV